MKRRLLGLPIVTMRYLTVLLSLALACTLTACGGDSTDPSPQLKPVASVTVHPSELSLTVGQTGTLTAETRDAEGAAPSGRAIAWSTSDATIATVSTAGVVSGVAAGPATVTATSEGKSGSATVTVTPIPVASVTVTPPTATVVVGATVQLAAATLDAAGNPLGGRTVSWVSSNPVIATVSPEGLASAVTPGTATITVSSEGKTGSATLTVIPVPVASVTVSPATLDLIVGQSGNLTAAAKDATGNTLGEKTFTWVSSAPTIATVSTAGVVTAFGAGQATITVTSEGQSAAATVSVRAAVASVAVTPASATIVVDESVSLTATPKDDAGSALTGREVSWSTGNAGVATVSTSGVVTAIAPGTTSMTASSEGKSGTAAITVLPLPVASVAVTPGAASVVAGTTVTLTATPMDGRGNALPGRSVAWTSSNATLAVVSQSGVVTAIAQGTATMTATAEGKSGTATITVTPAPVATVDVLPGAATMTVGQSLRFVATPRDASGNPLTNRAIAWATSNAGVATVSTTGTVTCVGAGTATITAMSEEVPGSATVAVAGSFSTQAVLSQNLVVEGSPITYSLNFGFGFSAISTIDFHFVFGDDPLDPDECLMWLGGFCNPLAVPQTSRTLRTECSGDPVTCDLLRDGVDTRQIAATRFTGSGVVSVQITSLKITVQGTPLPASSAKGSPVPRADGLARP